MKKKFTLSILLAVCLFISANAQQWANTGTGPFSPQEVFVVGNTIRNYSIVANYQSSDNGDTWTKDTLKGMGLYPDVFSIEKCGSKYFSGDEHGKLFESTDAITWTLNHTFANGGLPYIFVDGNNIYVVGDGVGIYYSTDAGANWNTGNSGLSNTGKNNISQIVKAGSDIFISTLDGVYKSTDNCATWVKKSNGLATSMACNGIAYTGGALLTSGYGVGVYRSTDLGENWTQITNGFNGFLFVGGFYTNGSLTVVGGSTCKAHFSTDGGLTWKLIGVGIGFGSSVFNDFTVFNDILFCASTGYCMKIALSDLGIGSGISDNKIPQNNFTVYPNPTSNTLTVDFGNGNSGSHELTIYNNIGQQMRFVKVTGYKSVVDISNFPSGIYYFTSQEGTVKGNSIVILKFHS